MALLAQFKIMNNKGFTLIELLVSVAIIAVLSGIILYSVTQYISKGKDSNISGNLAILIPAGEVYYNVENAANQDGYAGFCDPNLNSVLRDAVAQMPQNTNGSCYAAGNLAGVCCVVATTYHDAWAACAREFTNGAYAYCVDSRGIKKEICEASCAGIVSNSISACPDDVLSSCSSQ